ncbi:protein-L-isoaspartate(D-aspartate) O-methyltransferase [Acetobacterium paludosum]|uniref:Protein-L-isoaspartate O-methyltransferase n=1 Tax=Acetobacterium paludosum TaxID=52693 RepID=A0A923I1Y1_9FIRM|nr:protein-L-isoaspartate(D-aspartate) O-methyltransferase [Acetobacterium paludosum]
MEHEKLIEYFNSLDRSYFIDNEMKTFADLDTPLPIGHGQTISQPSLVLEMTRLLEPEKGCKVLEIGTGSGYQTALLAKFSGNVFTIERIEELAKEAKKRLDALGYTNIYYKIGDGSEGWLENAPYDRIMVTAAAGSVPTDLLDQLANGGRMIIPIGPESLQELQLIIKDNNGEIHIQSMVMVKFVEMKGKYGWSE